MSGLLFAALIVATPFLLQAVSPGDANWGKLSEISQAYGAVSVPLSAAALAGVVASLAYQARQTRIAQEDAHRSTHRELILLALASPALRPCWEPPFVPMTSAEWERIAFTNLIMSGWENAFRLGSLSDDQLRLTLRGHFSGAPARMHWANARDSWIELVEHGTDRRARDFARITEECFQAAVLAGPGVQAADYFIPEPTNGAGGGGS
ncbi:DUF6082 family protein [Streptomyces polygonati]|uniref:DUF6082 family protein n=1 Tax=Streptomyces polygonati TaxID=1617087 RepID=A0ABV8HM73_9ACTN